MEYAHIEVHFFIILADSQLRRTHFNLTLDNQPTTTGFTMSYTSYQITCIRFLRVQYLTIDRAFNYHINTFNNFQANYSNGPLNTITVGLGIRIYTNTISYSALAASLPSSFTNFNPNLSENGIVLYLTGVFLDDTSMDFDGILLQSSVINSDQFNIIARVFDKCKVFMIRLSMIIFDKQSISSSRVCTVQNQVTTFRINDNDPLTYSLVSQLFSSSMVGLLRFIAKDNDCGLDYNWNFATNRIVFDQSEQYAGADYNCETQRVFISFFISRSWICPTAFPYYKLSTQLCDDNCLPYEFGNIPGQYCQPCNFACFTCTSGVSSGCTSCNPADKRQLSSAQCLCMSGYVEKPAGSLICTACSTFIDNCLTCQENTPDVFRCLTCLNISYALNAANQCNLCHIYIANCLQCTSSTVCILCDTTNQFFVNSTNQCQQCSLSNCINCASLTQCLTCTGTNVFLNPSTQLCETCSLTNCVTCLSLTQCSSCTGTNVFLNPSTQLCETCSLTNCVTCLSLTQCSTCTLNNVFLNQTTGLCQTCVSINCQTCDSSGIVCTTCLNGFTKDANDICINSNPSCSLMNCQVCDGSGTSCATCNSNFEKDSNGNCITSCTVANCQTCDESGLTCTTCLATFFKDTNGDCISCETTWGQQCVSCSQTNCMECSPGYTWNISSSGCELTLNTICGDQIWITSVEACDDGNLDNNDGCDSQCQVQPDYVCDVADRLPSGASLCKFTKEVAIQLDRLEKQPNSNTVHMFLSLEPSTFKQWTQENVQTLISSIQIIDPITNSTSTLSPGSYTVKFERNEETNTIELVFDYGEHNLEQSTIQFNFDIAATNLPSLQYLPIRVKNFVSVISDKNAVYLYGYDQETYEFQAKVSSIASGIGFTALIMAFAGFFLPIGKLIIVEALAVIQISFFGVMQFDKVPPTFVGLRNLGFSNGYNSPDMLSSSQSRGFQNVFALMGIQSSALTNFNISFVLLIILPTIIGSVGLLIHKVKNKNAKAGNDVDELIVENDKYEPLNDSSASKDEGQFVNSRMKAMMKKLNSTKAAQSKLQTQEPKKTEADESEKKQEKKPVFSPLETISERVLFEFTFYGICLSSYLGWVSCFYSFSSLALTSLVGSGLFALFTLVFSFLFVKFPHQEIEIENKAGIRTKQSLRIATKFGEFSEAPVRMTQNTQEGALPRLFTKIYLIFLIERVLSSCLIVFLASATAFVGAMVIGVQCATLVTVVILSKKFKVSQDSVKKDESRQQKNAGNEVTGEDPVATQLPKAQGAESKVLDQRSFFEALSKNYLLRQGVNYGSAILIQSTYLLSSIVMTTKDPFDTFVNNALIVKAVPMTVLALLGLNLLFNVGMLVLEVKYGQVVSKAKLILKAVFNGNSAQTYSSAKDLLESSKDFSGSQTNDDQAQVVQLLNKIAVKSIHSQLRENFLKNQGLKADNGNMIMSEGVQIETVKNLLENPGIGETGKAIEQMYDEI